MPEESEVENIRERLREAREAYYNLSPIITDQEYDALRDRLQQLAPEDSEVLAVGASPPKLSIWQKVEHEIPMGSLSKVNSSAEFDEWVAARYVEKSRPVTDDHIDAPDGAMVGVRKRVGDSWEPVKPLLFTHKVDGSSMELVYKNGDLVRCVTRGDGKVGEDVTANISRVPSVPRKLAQAADITVRGEIVMLKDVFAARYAAEYANPRNTAAGKVRDTKATDQDCESLTFLAYSLIMAEAPETEGERFRLMASLGFRTPEYGEGRASGAAAFHEALASGLREKVPYEIDGTVIRLNDICEQEELGEHNMRPRGQVAYKFDAASGVTRVLDMKWQVGPTGRITPVASVEPVEIGGVTITSISVHNMSMFRELGLYPNCRVLVTRRNDVIPYIEERLD